MQYTKALGKCASLLVRCTAITILSATFMLFVYLQAQAAEIVVEGGCTLVDAISSANADSGVGDCTPGSGADTVVLSDTVYGFAVSNNSFGGSNNALPPITSTVAISGNGATLLRDQSLGCDVTTPITQTFRFFLVDTGGDLTLDDVTLQNGCNSAGGAILAFEDGNLTVRNSSVLSNTALGDGGGILFFVGRIENSLFRDNSTLGEGGALMLIGSEDKYLLSNEFFGNRSVESGAAIYLSSGRAQIDNNVFAGNLPEPGEGASDIALGSVISPSILLGQHNTLAAASGVTSTAILAGVDAAGDQVFITDTIISGYAVGLGAFNSSITANGILWDDTATPTLVSGAGAIDVSNERTGEAAFANPAAQNYHLTAASAAIDQGTSNEPATDFDGDTRPAGAASDFGFDEFVPEVSVVVNKTVGTDSNTCGDSDLLTVPRNTVVFYCFTIQNTGDITFTEHTIADPVLDVNTTISFDLAPSATVQITRSMISELGPVTATASITNTVFVTSTNEEDDEEETVGVQGVEQFVATASDNDVAVVRAEDPTALPETEQPEQIGDNRIYLPSLH